MKASSETGRPPEIAKKGLARAQGRVYTDDRSNEPRISRVPPDSSRARCFDCLEARTTFLMASLAEQLCSGEARTKVVDDACKVLDQEVADKGGITGLAIKGAYKVLQGIKPGFVREVVDALLDDFLGALDPLYQEALSKQRPPGAYLRENASRVADALLQVTDQRATQAKRQVVRSAYDKLRPMAKKQVEAAAPRLADLLDRHAARTA